MQQYLADNYNLMSIIYYSRKGKIYDKQTNEIYAI